MKRRIIVGIKLKHLAVDLLRLLELPGFMKAQRRAERIADVREAHRCPSIAERDQLGLSLTTEPSMIVVVQWVVYSNGSPS